MAKAVDDAMTLQEVAVCLKIARPTACKLAQECKSSGQKTAATGGFTSKDLIDTCIKTGVPPTQAHGKPRAKTKKRKKASQSCGIERERNAEDIRQH